MKASALIVAAALAVGTAANAQQTDSAAARGETTAGADSMKPADDAQRTKKTLKDLGQKTRSAMHRAGDKMRHAAKADKADRQHAAGDRQAHKERRSDVHAMGAARDTRDAETSRRQRMDDAYANWKAKLQKNG